MAYGNAFQNQIKNRNFLSPTGFKFTLNRAPKVSFFGNTANIPALTLGVAEQPTYLRDLPTPGDKIIFDDFTIRFLVDEDLKNYLELSNWIRGLGYPETLQEIRDLQTGSDQPEDSGMNIFSDATLQVLTSSQVPNFKVVFNDLWPYTLSALDFDATNTDIEYFTAEASFKYTMFNIQDLKGNNL
tara:strand:- start:48 stop:602 length:555 start_codon:yes stop_codon:yes gene_type:complete